MSLAQHIDNLVEAYQAAYKAAETPLLVEPSDEWKAPIYLEEADADWVHWQPLQQSSSLAFTDLANALEQPLHADLEVLFGRWYAADLAVEFDGHPLWLLQNHGPEDAVRLQSNLAGHVLMKRRLKQPITLFIGLAEESDDLLISLDNDSGQVGLEFVGQPHHEILAANLAEFVQKLTPRVVDPRQ